MDRKKEEDRTLGALQSLEIWKMRRNTAKEISKRHQGGSRRTKRAQVLEQGQQGINTQLLAG